MEQAHRASLQAALQADRVLLDSVAKDLAVTYGGTVIREMAGLHMFVVSMPESQVMQMAQDPRIKLIGVDELIKGIPQ